MTITDFLLARLGAEENIAKAASRYEGGEFGSWAPYRDGSPSEIREQVKRQSPSRTLADCDSKRRLIGFVAIDANTQPQGPLSESTDWHQTATGVLMLLAAPYAGHPDFDAAWAIS